VAVAFGPSMPARAQTQTPTKPATPLDAAAGGAAAADRALALLRAFVRGDDALSLAELAQRTGLYKSTALRLLASLEHARLIERRQDGRYALGGEIARLYGVYEAAFSLDRIVLPVLRQLVATTGESAAYHIRQGQPPNHSRLCLYRVDSPHPVRDHIRAGDVLPLSRGTGGRVLSAWGGGDQTQSPSSEELQLYAQIRDRGYYATTGDRLADVAGISVPVFRRDGQIAAAVTLTMPAHRYDEQHLGAVLSAARQLTGAVG
jgi:DNA-binding IclR family transcriptional regulator